MVQAAKEKQDQSMEEILSSIKRIIAEEGDEVGNSASANGSAGGDAKGSDILELTDVVAAEAAPAQAAPKPAAAPAPQPKPQPQPQGKAPDVLANIDSLLSKEAAQSSMAALRSLTHRETPMPRPSVPSPQFRSGNTVEDLVLESLRPMLKEWLDANLPSTVERLVEKEIKKISANL